VPDLLKIAKADNVSRKVKRSAVFWLGQAAGDAATRGLTDLVDDGSADHEVRETAVFALSQRPKDEGVPALIRIARSNKDPELASQGDLLLGQSDDPRALSLFEELLTRPEYAGCGVSDVGCRMWVVAPHIPPPTPRAFCIFGRMPFWTGRRAIGGILLAVVLIA